MKPAIAVAGQFTPISSRRNRERFHTIIARLGLKETSKSIKLQSTCHRHVGSSSLSHASSPSTSAALHCLFFVGGFCTGGPKLGTVTALYKAGLHHDKGAAWKHTTSSPTRTLSRSFPGFTHPRCRFLHLCFLNFPRSPVSPQSIHVPLSASSALQLFTAPPSLVLSANRYGCCPISQASDE